MSTNHPDTRDDLISYCKRKLGEPVLEVNVALEQVEDRIDDALEYYQEFHSDATVRTYLKHLVTESDVTNGYIPISSDVIFVQRLFPVNSASGVNDWSGIKYQIMLNDVGNLGNFMSELVYYEQMQQHMSLLDMKINGTPQVSFSRRQNRLIIHGEFGAGDIKAGDYIVRINDNQVQGKSLTEAVELMRGPVGSSIKLTIRRKNVKKSYADNFLK